jgi:hypothetical protein
MDITVINSNPKNDIEILKWKPLAGRTALMLPGVSRKVKVAAESLYTSSKHMGIEEVQLHSRY